MIATATVLCRGKHRVIVRAGSLLGLFLAGCLSRPVVAQRVPEADTARPAAVYLQPDELDPTTPSPESIIGHKMGERAVRYEPMVRYLHALAESSPLVTLTPYAESHEGRTLYHLTITSEANHGRLGQFKADNGKLADPRRLSDPAEADRIIETLPGVAWMAYSIHGDELSSTDAALQLAYQLVAGTDEATRRLRGELIIHVDPLMNPDGRERYQSQLQHLTGRVPNTDYQAMQHRGLWSAGRGNHYLFDLNRDWLMQVHPETRGRAARMLDWNPHLVVDSHEMGPADTYLFDPPNEPLNVDLSTRNMFWRGRFSAEQARAFDRHGWSYYTREWYEEWYPGYTNAWASLLGAVGLLYEQASVSGASVKQPAGQTLTYGQAVRHQLVSSMANLETLRANREAILRDYLADRRWAIAHQDTDANMFLVAPSRDRSKMKRLLDLLDQSGIEAAVATGPFEAKNVVDVWGLRTDTREFGPGALVVSSAQPHRRLLQAFLGFDPHMTEEFLADERKDLEKHRGSRIYDVTAWNVGMAFALDAFWAQAISEAAMTTAAPRLPDKPAPTEKRPAYGYVIDGADSDIYRAIVRLLDRQCTVRVAEKPFTLAGKDFGPGTALLRGHENPADLPRLLREITIDLGVDAEPVDTALCEEGPDLGGPRFRLLVPPRVAIASQWPIAATSFGSTWHLLDVRTELRASPVNVQRLGSIDLRKYNVIVLPHTWDMKNLGGVLTEQVRTKLRTWVEAGGTLVAMGDSAAFLAREDHGLGSVRLRRDVLNEIDLYDEAVEHEIRARKIVVDPEALWGTAEPIIRDDSTPTGTTSDRRDSAPASDLELETLKRADAWQRLFAPKGTFVAATQDVEHWLCFGLGDRLPVLIRGDYAFLSRHPVATPVRLGGVNGLRLSGLLWPEARSRWARSAYATVERLGYGQIILFAADPFFRGYCEGTGRLLLNALVLGPGMGTRQVVPW